MKAAAERVRRVFGQELLAIKTLLDDLAANFQLGGQGPASYADQMLIDHPELDAQQIRADAVLAVAAFHEEIFAFNV